MVVVKCFTSTYGEMKNVHKTYNGEMYRKDNNEKTRLHGSIPLNSRSLWPSGLRRGSFDGLAGSNPVGGMDFCLL